jgi:hypothetical protein
MTPRSLPINHPSELNALTAPRPFRKPGRGAIRLSREFAHPDKARWEAEINRQYYACGCSSGAKGLLLAFALGLGMSIGAHELDALSLQQAIALPVGTSILGAVIGKLSALANARRRLIRVIHTVQANWHPADKQERDSIACG